MPRRDRCFRIHFANIKILQSRLSQFVHMLPDLLLPTEVLGLLPLRMQREKREKSVTSSMKHLARVRGRKSHYQKHFHRKNKTASRSRLVIEPVRSSIVSISFSISVSKLSNRQESENNIHSHYFFLHTVMPFRYFEHKVIHIRRSWLESRVRNTYRLGLP